MVRLPQHSPVGHEQEGLRPGIVVGRPPRLGQPRYPTLIIVPLTTARNQGWARQAPNLYPLLRGGNGGLPFDSLVLLDQVRAVDAGRVVRRIGSLDQAQYLDVHSALIEMFHP